jgi:hypothetical protein
MGDIGEILALAWGLAIVIKDVALTYVMVGCVALLSEDGKADFIAASRRRIA